MIFEETSVSGAWLIVPDPQTDERGSFARIWDEKALQARALPTHIVQSGVSFNLLRGTLRGMHYQARPHEENKYVRCTRGSVHDVILDLRRGSNTYRTCFAVTLSATNMVTLVVPPGCAHGFLSLEDSTEVFYQINRSYAPAAARGVRWNDPYFAIDWPFSPAVISERDRTFEDYSG